MTKPSRILVVDDEVIIQALLTEVLEEEGYQVTTADNGEQAIRLLKRGRFDLIIADIIMPRANGIEVLLAAKRLDSDYPVIMITGYPSVNTAVRLVNLGATDYITKPFNVDLIKVTVAKVLEVRRMRGETGGPPPDGRPAIGAGPGQICNPALFSQLLEKEIERSQWRGHLFSVLVARTDSSEDYSPGEISSPGDQLMDRFAVILARDNPPGRHHWTDRPDGVRGNAARDGPRRCLGSRATGYPAEWGGASRSASARPASLRDARAANDLVKAARAALRPAEERVRGTR